MKTTKIILPLFASMLLAGCNTTNNQNNNFPIDSKDTANVYAFEAATSIGLIGKTSISNLAMLKASKDVDQSIIDELIKYLPSVEAALTGLDELIAAKEETSDLAEYTTKMSVTYKDINLKDNSFVMYYNETLEFDDDHDDNDQEVESSIEGIIKIGDNTYPIRGEKELDVDEYEVSFIYQLDDNASIKVEQEIENDVTEFQYEVIIHGRSIYEYSLEVKKDKVELEVEDEKLGEKEIEFKLINRDSKTLILAEFEDEMQKVEVLFEKITNNDGTSSYVVVK